MISPSPHINTLAKLTFNTELRSSVENGSVLFPITWRIMYETTQRSVFLGSNIRAFVAEFCVLFYGLVYAIESILCLLKFLVDLLRLKLHLCLCKISLHIYIHIFNN